MRSCILLFAAMTVLAPAASLAATTTSNLAVQITISAACTVSSSTALDFSSAGVLSAAVDAFTDITVTCTNTTPYVVSLGAGNGSGATTANRKMTSGAGATVTYSLYSNSTRSSVWGTSSGVDTVAGTGNGSAQTLRVYGRVPAQTTPAPGTYTDTVAVTVTY